VPVKGQDAVGVFVHQDPQVGGRGLGNVRLFVVTAPSGIPIRIPGRRSGKGAAFYKSVHGKAAVPRPGYATLLAVINVRRTFEDLIGLMRVTSLKIID
jgi:hypothetical protein